MLTTCASVAIAAHISYRCLWLCLSRVRRASRSARVRARCPRWARCPPAETTTTTTKAILAPLPRAQSAACAAFIASMTDDALQDMSTGFARCTGAFADYSAYGAGGMHDGYLAHVVRETASDCGLPSALSPISGRRRMALKAVEPIGASTFWNAVNAVHRRMALKAVEPIGASTSWNSVHPLRKKYRARLTTLAAVKPSRRTTVARRLISTEGRKPICANGWVWPEPSPPPPSPPPPLPVVTAFIQAEGDVSDYPRPKLAEMEQKVAVEVGVGVAAVSITVSSGSVILKVPHGMPQETLT